MAASDLFKAFLVQKMFSIMNTNSKLSFLIHVRIFNNCVTKLLIIDLSLKNSPDWV